MKKTLFTLFFVLLLLTSCSREYTVEDIVSLELTVSNETVQLGTGVPVIFEAIALADDGTVIPCEEILYYCNGELSVRTVQTGPNVYEEILKPYLETSEPGTYKITARYNDIESNAVEVTVLPEKEGTIQLNANKTTFFAKGTASFTPEYYTADGELLTTAPTVYVNGSAIEGNRIRLNDPGIYTVYAEADGLQSLPEIISVVEKNLYDLTLTTDKTTVQPKEKISFNVEASAKVDGMTVDSSLLKIKCIQTGEEISDGEYTPSEEGYYSFYLDYGSQASKAVHVKVEKEKAPAEFDFTTFTLYDSEIPVIVIDTYGKEITKEKSTATMYIFDKEYNQQGDAPDVISLIDIKLRGQSSLDFPKKQYSIHTKNEDGTNNNISLLGMPQENDWVLNGSYADKSLIKNSLMYDLMAKVTEYSARNEFCEVYLTRPDGTLDYLGIYSLIEKIKIDKNRVDIHKMTDDDTNITGGYIVAIDKIVADEIFVETSMWDVTIVSPNDEKLTEAQYDYIAQYLKEFSLALEGENRADPVNGYRKYFEPESIVGQLLLDEWIRNIDCMRFSAYMYKDKDSKLKFGPPWDFDITCGRCDYGEGWIVEGWEMGSMNDLCIHLMWDPTFVELFVATWKEYRTTFLTDELIIQYIDEKVAELGTEPLARSLNRWNRQWDGETYVWPNPVGELYSYNHAQEIQFIKDFLIARAHWMDENIDDLLVGDIKKKIW